MVKRFLIVTFLVMMLLALAACSADEVETPQSEVPNPVRQSSAEKIQEELGFNLLTPDGAVNITYSIIDMGDLAEKIAQVDFTLDEVEYIYQACVVMAAAEQSDITTGKTFDEENYDNNRTVISWFDAASGIQYSLSMDSEADHTVLWFLAEQLFQPVR